MRVEEYDLTIKTALESLEGGYKEGSWEKMESILESRKKKRVWPIILFAGLISTSIGSLVFLSTWLPNESKITSSSDIRSLNESQGSNPEKGHAVPSDRQHHSDPQGQESSPIPSTAKANPSVKSNIRTDNMPGENVLLGSLSKTDDRLDDGALTTDAGNWNSLLDPELIKGIPVSEIPVNLDQGVGDLVDVDDHWPSAIGLNVFAGIPVSTNAGFESESSVFVPFYGGVEFVYIPTVKWEFSIGLAYELLTLSSQTEEVHQTYYVYGYERETYQLTPQNASYLSLPITAHYKTSPRTRVNLGIQYGYLLQVYTQQIVTASEQGSSSIETTESIETGYRSSLKENQVSILAGFGYQAGSRIRLDLQARYGLTSLYENGGSSDRFFMKVGLSYYLWRK